MTVNASLPISSLINVTASLAAAAVQAQSTQTMLILGNSAVIDVTTRIASFTSATAVSTLFGSSAPETLAATVWFGQTPQPTQLYIGRWAETATAGQLIGAPLSATQQLITNFTTITDGGFNISIGGTAQNVIGLNFSSVTNLNGVASAINAVLTGATVAFNATNGNFVVTSATTGTTSTVGFASAPTGGGGVTNISTLLGLATTSSGAYVANGIAAESAIAAVSLFDAQFGQLWYGLSVLGAADTDVQAIVPFLAASSNKHFYWASTQEAGVLVAATTTDIASELSSANSPKVAVQYNGSSPYAAISLAAKMLTVNYSASNTVIQAMWQTEPGITPDALNSTQLATVIAKNANVFVGYNNGAYIIQPGVCSNGQYIDTTIGADALCLAIQTAVFNLLYTTHVPQTDAGMAMIKVTIENVLASFATNGYIAPGVWNSAGFGTLTQGATLTNGYYVYAPAIASQAQAQRQQRLSVPFQIAAKLAGSVATVNVAIVLNN